MTRAGPNLALCPDEAVAQHGDYVQLLHGTRAWTSTEVRDASRRLAGALVELGLLPGDRVLTLLPNRPEVLVVYFAAWRAGATCVPVLARMTAAELASRIAHSGAKVIVTAAELHAKVRDALAALTPTRLPQVVVLDGPAAAPAHAFDDLIRTGRAISPVPTDPDALALVMYTGGTTGAPKGAMITHRGLDATTRYVAEGLDRPISLLAIPLAHIAGICWGLGYLRKGGRAILFDAFDAATLLRSIHEHRVQVIPGAPWMFWALATHPDAKRHDTSSMRLWVYASAPMPLHQVEAFEATFRTRLHTVYGLTESSGGVTRTAPDQPRKPGSVGRVQPGAPHELHIVGEDGRPLPPGEVGEIVIGGVAISPGYLGLAEETAATFQGGWLATGDLGWQDADGDVFLAGRKKELIISAGFNVYPAEVEGVIADLPGVHGVAVIGVPDPELGERPMAFVAPVRRSGLSRDDVVRHCVRRLTSYKVPAVQLVDRLPLMDTGKVDKRRLAELAPRRGAPGEAPPPARGAEATRSDVARRIEARLRVLLDAPPDARLARDRPLMELGLDSLRAVQLRDELADELELRGLAPTVAFDHPTIDALAEHVLRLRSPADLTAAPAAAPAAPPRPAAEREPIAVIGMACRLPGGVEELDDLWALLRHGRDGTGPVPRDRWDPRDFGDPALERGGFLDDVRGFDAALFGIPAAEAEGMDPQQRWLLETAWRAIEHAGVAPDRLAGSRTGVVIGISTDEYAYLGDLRRGAGAYGGGTGGFPSVAAGRLAHLWGLQGPCYAVDTACSSSLVAIHQACRALESGEADLMLAGGVNAILTPRFQVALAAVGALAPDGRCKPFDERADGFARSEGCAVVLLKRLADAERDGDPVLAVILGTAINHDGRASALTAPSGSAQEALLRDCARRAGVSPGAIDYVEAHGTGTPLGDPIEVGALARVYGQAPDRARELYVGSVKSNLGHLESAAGAAGLIKIVLMLRRGELAPTIHCHGANPHLPLQGGGVAIATRAVPWPGRAGRRRVAGVSSFGISGTNAHALIAEAPPRAPAARPAAEACHVALVSARTDAARAALAARYAAHLRERPSIDAAGLCVTLGTGRARLPSSGAAIGADRRALEAALEALARGEEAPGVVLADARPAAPRLAFLFTGQGAQHPGMGRALFEAEPVFRAALERCAALAAASLERPLLDAIYGAHAGELLALPTYAQPAQLAISYALSELWRSWGVAPAAVIGHSFGEYAAAVVAGALGLEDALHLAAARGRIVDELAPGGGMLAIEAPRAELDAVLAEVGGGLGIAAVNAPELFVISGPTEPLERAARHLERPGRQARRLRVPHAFHSPMMAAAAERFRPIAERIAYAAPRLPLAATLEGRFFEPGEVPGADYWTGGLVRAVRWGEAFEQLVAAGYNVLVEVSAHPVLLGMAPRIALAGAGLALIPSLRRDPQGAHADRATIAAAAARVALAGIDVDWRAYEGVSGPVRVEAPGYPFERRPYWLELPPEATEETTEEAAAEPGPHPLLGAAIRTGDAAVFEATLELGSAAWLADHRIAGAPVFPGTAYLELLLAAAARAWGWATTELRNVDFLHPLLLGAGAARTVQVRLERAGGRGEVWTRPAGDANAAWTRHVAAELRPSEASGAAGGAGSAGEPAATGNEVPVSALYGALRELGLDYGPWFQGLRRAWRAGAAAGAGTSAAAGEIELPRADPALAAFAAHPAIVDACFHLAFAALPEAERGRALVPIRVERVIVHGAVPARVRAEVSISSIAPDSIALDLRARDAGGRAVLELFGARFRRVSGRAFAAHAAGGAPPGRAASLEDVCYELAWQPRSLPGQAYAPRPAAAISAIAPDVLAALDAAAIAARGPAGLDGPGADELERGLRALGRWYVLRALRELGWRPAQPPPPPARLAARLGVVHTHRRLLARMLAMLEETGGVPTDPGAPDAPRDAAPPIDAARLAAAAPGSRPLLELFTRCGEALGGVLAGRTDPLSVVFSDWDTVAAVYERDPLVELCNGLVAGVVAAAVATAPPGRPVRILEVGAGTGGTTSHVLPRLAGHDVEYVFTDVSETFLAAARRRFAGARPELAYRLLDLERAPEEQGFSPGYFDVIIEANAVHATRDLRATLERLRTLAAPGALFVLSETLEPCPFIDLTFGLTHGWWLFSDRELRDHPLIDEAVWPEVLASAGFDEIAILPGAPAGRRGPAYRQGVIACRAAVGPPPVQAAATSPLSLLTIGGSWLVLCDRGGVGRELAARLAAAGGAVTAVGRDDGAAIAELARAWAGRGAAGGIVYLWGLDATLAGDAPAAELEAAIRGATEPLLELAATIAGEPTAAPLALWIATRGAVAPASTPDPAGVAQAPLWGVGRVIANELPALRCRRVDLDADLDPAAAAAHLAAELAAADDEDEIALSRHGRLVSRVVRWRAPAAAPGESTELVLAEPGSFDGLAHAPRARRAPAAHEVEIEIEASGVNFHDVLKVLGVMGSGGSGRPTLGGECAGRITRAGAAVTGLSPGDLVVSVAPGSYARYVVADAALTVRVPPGLSAIEAATIPQAFLAAHHGLVELGGLARGQRVLIHAAAGGVGQAAVQLALAAGAEVHATAGTPEKRALVRRLGVAHVYDSRSAAFFDEILGTTGGAGVDLALSALTGEPARLTRALVRPGGIFVELGRGGRAGDHPDGVRWAGFRMDELARDQPGYVRRSLFELLARVARGELRPLPATVHPLTEAAGVLRAMAQGRHTGKLVLVPTPAATPVFRADGTYLVTGGLGGIGPELAAWMAARGAGAVVLAGRHPPDGATARRLDELRAAGHRIEAEVADVLDATRVAALIDRLGSRLGNRLGSRLDRALPPLRGVLHAAGVVDDAALPEQSWDRFAPVLSPKALGAWNLGRAARAAPLDFVALFGSLSSVLGLPGQANHAGANALLDALARAFPVPGPTAGPPTITVSWGAWDRFGYAARTGALAHLARRGVSPLPPELAFEALERAIAHRAPHVIVCAFDWERLFASWREAGLGRRFAGWRPAEAAAVAPPPTTPAPAPAAASTAPQATAPDVAARLSKSVSDVLGVRPDAIDLDRPIAALGIDSLVVVELRNRWRRQLGCELPADWPSRFPTLRAVAAHVAPAAPAAPTAPAAPAPAAQPAPAPAARVVPLAAPAPIVCIHPAGGTVTVYAELARRLAAAGHATLAIEHPRRAGEDLATLEALAREHARLLCATVPRGPYRLLGWSVGGALAHAMAAELERTGAAVELLAVIDPPSESPDAVVDPLELLLASFGDDAYRDLLRRPPERLQPIRALPRRALPAMAAEVAAAAAAAGLLPAPLTQETAAEQLLLVGTHLALARRYRPGPVRAAMIAVVPTHHAASARNLAPWSAWTSTPPAVLTQGGDHFSIIHPPGLDAWLPALTELLARLSAHLSAPSPTEGPR